MGLLEGRAAVITGAGRGIGAAVAACAILAPDEAFEDPHFAARGVQMEVERPDGAARYRIPASAFPANEKLAPAPSRAPRINEHGAAIRAELQHQGELR